MKNGSLPAALNPGLPDHGLDPKPQFAIDGKIKFKIVPNCRFGSGKIENYYSIYS